MQYFYVSAMIQGIENYKEDEQQSDYRPYMMMQAMCLVDNLRYVEKNCIDELSRVHYEQLRKRLVNQLKLN